VAVDMKATEKYLVVVMFTNFKMWMISYGAILKAILLASLV